MKLQKIGIKQLLGILIYQGITSNELCQLKVNHLNLDEGRLTIPKTTRNRKRIIALRPNQIATLIYYLNSERPELRIDDNPHLFLTMRGTKLTVDGLHSIVNRLQGVFDKPISPKSIRQSVISYWLNVKLFPIEGVQVMAGHRYPSSTEKYIQQGTNKQRDIVNRLCEQVFGQCT